MQTWRKDDKSGANARMTTLLVMYSKGIKFNKNNTSLLKFV